MKPLCTGKCNRNRKGAKKETELDEIYKCGYRNVFMASCHDFYLIVHLIDFFCYCLKGDDIADICVMFALLFIRF